MNKYKRSDSQRPKRPSPTTRTTDVKEVGTPPVRSSLLFQEPCGTKSQRQSPDNQLLKPEAKDSSSHYDSQLHLPLQTAPGLCPLELRVSVLVRTQR